MYSSSFRTFEYDPSLPTSLVLRLFAKARGLATWRHCVKRCLEKIPRCVGERIAHVVWYRGRFGCVACALSCYWREAASTNMRAMRGSMNSLYETLNIRADPDYSLSEGQHMSISLI